MRDRRSAPGRRLWALLLPIAFLAACGGGDGTSPPADDAATIDRETFVEVYVELRIAALGRPERQIDPSARERILSSHGVTRDDLLEFVEVHGDRAGFMRDVWVEVEGRIETLRNPDDTTST